MKNIFEIMKEYGLEIPEDKVKDFEKAVLENYKTTSDYNTQKEKLDNAEGKLKEVNTTLEDLQKNQPDVEKLNVTIKELQEGMANKDKEYKEQLAQRDFEDVLKHSISEAKGVNEKAIKALLDIDSLKVSSNQKEDIAKAIKELTEADDSKMLFSARQEDDIIGKNDVIGRVGGTGIPALTGVEQAFLDRNPDLKI